MSCSAARSTGGCRVLARRLERPAPVWLGLVLLWALAAGCGKKGPPLPPERFIPVATKDLSIHQQGQELIFRLTYPQATLAGAPLPGLLAVEIWELVAPLGSDGAPPAVDPQVFAQAASRLVVLQGPELSAAVAGDQIEARIALAESQPEGPALHVFAVRSLATSQDVSSFSNTVALVVRSPISPPADLRILARQDGIELLWQPSTDAVSYNVYRRRSEIRGYGDPLASAPDDDGRFLDQTAAYGIRYIYTVRGVASVDPLVESAAAGEQEIDYQDRFAPAPPTDLLALAEDGSARLAWAASPSPDVIGYHVYRQDLSGSFRRITDLPVGSLEYLDQGLTPGLSYRYRATAVDRVGNEGEAGAEVAVTVR